MAQRDSNGGEQYPETSLLQAIKFAGRVVRQVMQNLSIFGIRYSLSFNDLVAGELRRAAKQTMSISIFVCAEIFDAGVPLS